jgi:hypothetical protein
VLCVFGDCLDSMRGTVRAVCSVDVLLFVGSPSYDMYHMCLFYFLYFIVYGYF